MPRSRPVTVIAALLLLTSACVPILPTPDDFPPPPWTPIVEFPTPAAPPTATLAPRLQPILPSDMAEARTLFLLTQVAITAGDSGLIAERVLYPITVDLDASVPEVSQPGTYQGTVKVRSNDPAHASIDVLVDMVVTAPATWGKLQGTVTGLGYCDASPAPVDGADVFVQASTGMTWTLQTDATASLQPRAASEQKNRIGSASSQVTR